MSRRLDRESVNTKKLQRVQKRIPHVIVHSWASRTNLSQRGRAVAIFNLRLYFFSKRSCCCGDMVFMSGGHTFLSLKADPGFVNAASSCGFAACASRRASVGNMAGVRFE